MGVSNFSIFTAFKAKDGISPVFKTMSSASDKAATRFKAGMDKAKIAVTAFLIKRFQIGKRVLKPFTPC